MATERGGSEDGDVQLKFSNQLGVSPAVIAAGVSLATTYMNKDKGTGAGGGGGGGVSPGGGTPMQQQFTPQFSPVMQQQQESPGGTQSANPVQYATGSQTASPGIPGQPSITPRPSPLPLVERPIVQSDQMQQYLKWGVIGLIGVVGIKAYQNKNKKRRK